MLNCVDSTFERLLAEREGLEPPRRETANGFLDRGSANYAYLSIGRNAPDEPPECQGLLRGI